MRGDEKPPIRGKTSPYGFFVKMCYEEHKKKYPDESVQVTEISKKCADKWKTMTEDEKRRFYELAAKDQERYQAEIAAFGAGDDASKKKKKPKKDPNAPKRALSAFFFFSNERRQEVQSQHPEWKVSEVAKELGREWKAFTDEQKKVYEDKASDDKARYAEEIKTYREACAASTPAPQPVQPQQQQQAPQAQQMQHQQIQQQHIQQQIHMQQPQQHQMMQHQHQGHIIQQIPQHGHPQMVQIQGGMQIQGHPGQQHQVIMLQQPMHGGQPQQIMMVPQQHVEHYSEM
uniref:HMG box domain-containing protein n=1 Tax=Panagrellus redivivus TaxID=6233 RepID=A0A7E4ZUT0_PANRE